MVNNADVFMILSASSCYCMSLSCVGNRDEVKAPARFFCNMYLPQSFLQELGVIFFFCLNQIEIITVDYSIQKNKKKNRISFNSLTFACCTGDKHMRRRGAGFGSNSSGEKPFYCGRLKHAACPKSHTTLLDAAYNSHIF